LALAAVRLAYYELAFWEQLVVLYEGEHPFFDGFAWDWRIFAPIHRSTWQLPTAILLGLGTMGVAVIRRNAWLVPVGLCVLAAGLTSSWWTLHSIRADLVWSHLNHVGLATAGATEVLRFILMWGFVAAVGAALLIHVGTIQRLRAASRLQHERSRAVTSERLAHGAVAVLVLAGLLPFLVAGCGLVGWHLAWDEEPWKDADRASLRQVRSAHFARWRGLLRGAAGLSALAIVSSVGLWAAALARSRRLRSGSDTGSPPRWAHPGRWEAAGAVACGIGTGAILYTTAPLAGEVSAPLPPGLGWYSGECSKLGSVPPLGEGPDRPVDTTQVRVSPNAISVNDIRVGAAGLRAMLLDLRRLQREQDPSRPFEFEHLLFLLDSRVGVSRVLHALTEARAVNPRMDAYFYMQRRIQLQRPILGTVCGANGSAVRVRLECGEGSVPVVTHGLASVGELLGVLADIRRRGQNPCIVEASAESR